MKSLRALLFFTLTAISCSSFSQTIASCGSVEGYAYYHYAGLVSKKSSGFDKDKITGGMTTFQRLSDGSFDILIVDTRKKIISMVNGVGGGFELGRYYYFEHW